MTRFLCEAGGERLDAWLAGKAGEMSLSRSRVQKLIEDGHILVNGSPVKKNHRLDCGDTVELNLPEPAPSDMPAQDLPLDVIYEDADIIVINKRRGMVVHPGNGNRDGTLVNALIHHCGESLSDINGIIRPGIVHRLDKDTSGLIVAAKTNAAHQKLAADFKSRNVRKIYNAVVCGHVRPDSGRIELPIVRHATDRKRMAVSGRGGGRDAVTLFTVKRRIPGNLTWLEVEILTGRTHQIRVHLAHIGHPVSGDPIYGGRGAARAANASNARTEPNAPGGLLLHSSLLELTHPATGERLTFVSPVPKYFDVLISSG